MRKGGVKNGEKRSKEKKERIRGGVSEQANT